MPPARSEDEEHVRFAAVEPAHKLCTHRLWGGALQGKVAHALLVQPFCQQFKHGGELAEQQDAVPALHGSRDQLHAGFQLGAAAVQLSAMRRGSQQISRSRMRTANTAILSSGFAARSFSRASTTAAR